MALRVEAEPDPLAVVIPEIGRPNVATGAVDLANASGVDGAAAVTGNAAEWRRQALQVSVRIAVRALGHLTLLALLVPAILLMGGLVVVCTVAVLAPFVALPILHAPFPWPSLLSDGLTALGIQDARLVPAVMAAFVWLGVSSATKLLVLGIRWP